MPEAKHPLWILAERHYDLLCAEFNFLFGKKGADHIDIPFNIPGQSTAKGMIIVKYGEVKEVRIHHDCGIIEYYRHQPA